MEEYKILEKKLPLVTLMLFSYNQSKFIKAAVEGVLSQTYSPLEIIISDDCSSDNTFDIISELVDGYEGNHCVIINRNDSNLGLSQHVNHVVNRASGEILVFASGDDISLNTRVETIVNEWRNSKEDTVAFFSNLERIDLKGQPLGFLFKGKPVFAKSLSDLTNGKKCWTVGASFAAHKKVFESFKQLPSNVLQEDGCNAFRSLLLGNIAYIDKPLLKYRFHSGSLSQHNSPSKRLVLQRHEYYMHLSNYNDAVEFSPSDTNLIHFLKKKKRVAFAKHLFFKLPLLGFVYNAIRITLGRLKRSL